MILLKLFLLALSLLGFCLFSHRKIGVPLEFTPFFTVTALMTCLYVLGYLGSLEFNAWGFPSGFNPKTAPTVPVLYYGVRLLYVLGWCAGLDWLRTVRRDDDSIRSELTNPGLVLFFAGFFLIFFSLQSCQMRHTDDLHHWGLAVKGLSVYHGLPGVDSGMFFPEYPPGVSLFHYYISTFTNFREGTLFFSHNLLLLAGVVVLTYRISWKYFYVLFLIPYFAFILQNLFMHGPKCLMVDTTLAVFLAASLHLYFAPVLTGEPIFRRAIPLIPASAALVLTKHVGLVFAVILLAVVFVDLLIVLLQRRFRRNREPAIDAGPRPKRMLCRVILPIVFLFATPFAVSESWNFRCEHYAFPEKDLSRSGIAQNASLAFRKIESKVPLTEWPSLVWDRSVRERWSEAFEGAMSEERREIVKDFYATLFRQELNGLDCLTPREGRNLATFSLTCFILAMTGLLIFAPSQRDYRCRYVAMNLVVFAGAGGYLLFMLLVYLYAFDESSGARLASFQRYVGCYFHAWLLWLFGTASFCFARSEPKWIPRRIVMLLSAVLGLYLFFIGVILVFSFKEAVDWGLFAFLLYVAVYFRFVFMAMAGGLIFCLQTPATSPIACTASRLVWVLLLVFLLMRMEFAFRTDQTLYSGEESTVRHDVRECLRQIETEKAGLRKIRIIFETDDPVHDVLMESFDSFRYETYPDHSSDVETFGIDHRRWIHKQHLAVIDPEEALELPTPEEWSKSLIEQNVDGVFLYRTNDGFWDRFGGLFERGKDARNDECRFYRVIVLPDKSGVSLVSPEKTGYNEFP